MTKKVKGFNNLFNCKICTFRFNFALPEDRQAWFDNKQKCPSCGEPYCNLPPMEKSLRDLQDAYLADRSDANLSALYLCLVKYVDGLMLRYHQRVTYDPEYRKEQAHNAATYLLEYYLYRPDFSIQASFAGYVKKKIEYALYGKHNKPLGESYDFLIEQTGKAGIGNQIDEIENDYTFERVEEKIIYEQDVQHLAGFIKKRLKETRNSLTPLENLYRLGAMLAFFKGGAPEVEKYFIVMRGKGKALYEDSLELIKKELMASA